MIALILLLLNRMEMGKQSGWYVSDRNPACFLGCSSDFGNSEKFILFPS